MKTNNNNSNERHVVDEMDGFRINSDTESDMFWKLDDKYQEDFWQVVELVFMCKHVYKYPSLVNDFRSHDLTEQIFNMCRECGQLRPVVEVHMRRRFPNSIKDIYLPK